MYLVSVDKEMYHEETDTNAEARNMNITDLGQVSYVFSDKTGTLTQNMMHFKRCSVSGTIFGAPITTKAKSLSHDEQDREKVLAPSYCALSEMFREDKNYNTKHVSSFDAEMFLRTMSICHTVMVEQDLDKKKSDIQVGESSDGGGKSISFGRLKCKKKQSTSSSDDQEAESLLPSNSNNTPEDTTLLKNSDGAPYGHVYQAESPDEGALVSAASLEYGFQLVGRDSNGIQILCSSPSIFQREEVVERLRSGLLTGNMLAQHTSNDEVDGLSSIGLGMDDFSSTTIQPPTEPRRETWKILAVNKFDSARKRMSVLVRSPPELGSIPILLCKGADSSMLDPSICEGSEFFVAPRKDSNNDVPESIVANLELGGHDNDSWGRSMILNLQSHLGDFATEGLRTLVLAVRVLTEEECGNWLKQYHEAATSIDKRDEKLKQAASEIERNLHIVGATAIEDKLQKGVPETIQQIEQAGIKLWILTGDKMETAIEIGYSTKVLNPDMHLTAIPNETKDKIKSQIAMEFVYLLRAGKLPDYEDLLRKIEGGHGGCLGRLSYFWEQIVTALERFTNSISSGFWRFYYKYIRSLCGLISYDENELKAQLHRLKGGEEKIKRKQNKYVKRKNVRDYAFMLWNDYRKTPEGKNDMAKYRNSSLKSKSNTNEGFDGSDDELSLENVENISVSSGSLPSVFERAIEANRILDREQGDKKRVTLLERLFAVDRDVRHGRLMKHMAKSTMNETSDLSKMATRRALVIEGGALLHILGEDLLEEIFFAIANTCDAVIACRVSPKQKALLVRLVRNYVEPTPVTLVSIVIFF